MVPQSKPTRSRARLAAMRAILVAFGLFLGIALVALVETGLRAAHYAEPEPFFHRGPDVDGWGEMHYRGKLWASRFFFAKVDGQRLEPGSSVAEIYFSPKRPDEYRVAVVGESTVQGYPYPYNMTISKYLEAALADALPEKKVTVFNFGFTAVASYPVSRVVDEIVDGPELDAIIVLVGHNEFFGAYGVASSQYAGDSRRLMALHEAYNDLRIAKLLRRAVEGGDLDASDAAGGLIRVMAADNSISPDDSRRSTAARLLSANLEHIAETCRSRRIPVVFGTMPSNLSDFAPVGDSPAALADTGTRLDAAMKLEGADRLAALEELATRDRNHALLQYRLGKALAEAGRSEDARAAFVRARDIDGMPWRAPTATNDAIRETARRLGVPLADCEAEFMAATSEPAPGWDFFDDHVHPSRIGRMLYARVFAKSILDLLGRPGDMAKLRADEDYQRELGGQHLLSVREAIGRATSLMEKPPLATNNAEGAAYLRERMESMEKLMQPEEAAAWHQYAALVRQSLPSTSAALLAADAYMQAGKYREAIYQAQIARRSRPIFGLDFVQGGWIEGHCRHILGEPLPDSLKKDLDTALMVIDVFPKLQPGETTELVYSKGQIYWVQERFDEAIAVLEEGMATAVPERKEQFRKSIEGIRELQGQGPAEDQSTRLNIE